MDTSQAVLTVVAANFALMILSIGVAIALYLHTDKKIDAIAHEMKDFHGRLCENEGKRKAPEVCLK